MEPELYDKKEDGTRIENVLYLGKIRCKAPKAFGSQQTFNDRD